MRDYVTCPKFTNKPRLPDIFQTFVTFELFSRLYSFHLCCFVNYFLIKFKTCILKPRLGGDFSYSDVIMHKGHSSFQDLPPYVFADVWGVDLHAKGAGMLVGNRDLGLAQAFYDP